MDEGMIALSYPADFSRDPETGNWAIHFPDLGGVLTGTDSMEDAESEAIGCLASWLASRLMNHEEIPEPSPVQPGQRLIAAPDWIAEKIQAQR
jgi:predicted RNase H-like HicB family nuclease